VVAGKSKLRGRVGKLYRTRLVHGRVLFDMEFGPNNVVNGFAVTSLRSMDVEEESSEEESMDEAAEPKLPDGGAQAARIEVLMEQAAKQRQNLMETVVRLHDEMVEMRRYLAMPHVAPGRMKTPKVAARATAWLKEGTSPNESDCDSLAVIAATPELTGRKLPPLASKENEGGVAKSAKLDRAKEPEGGRRSRLVDEV
jgi:hypothetical protein